LDPLVARKVFVPLLRMKLPEGRPLSLSWREVKSVNVAFSRLLNAVLTTILPLPGAAGHTDE
jgi:hypothetical protein